MQETTTYNQLNSTLPVSKADLIRFWETIKIGQLKLQLIEHEKYPISSLLLDSSNELMYGQEKIRLLQSVKTRSPTERKVADVNSLIPADQIQDYKKTVE